jgi:hypothetical protein
VARDISIQRATTLMAMANSWQRLAADTGRYDDVEDFDLLPHGRSRSPDL